MHVLVPRLRLLVAVLALVLGAGSGLPGIVRALVGAGEHVCTCAAGGDHASCPVCNPGLLEHHRSRAPACERLPCGSGAFAAFAGGEVSILPPAASIPARILERTPLSRAVSRARLDVPLEPATPPPRAAA